MTFHQLKLIRPVPVSNWRRFGLRSALVAVMAVIAVAARGADEPGDAAARKKGLPWLDSLARGYTHAQRNQRPIFVRAGTASCRFCRDLSVEIQRPAVQEELKRWTLVEIDVDKSTDDARRLAVGPTPALRVLMPTGRVVAEEDGFMPADELVAWLKQNYDLAGAVPPDDLDAEGPPDAAAVARLVQAFRNRDAPIREAVIRRLLPHPDVAAVQVVEAFADGSLATRLAALELLREWRAPADGLDPWRKETLSAQRLAALAEWGADPARGGAAAGPRELSPADLAGAREMIGQLTAAPGTEVQAVRERLARYGQLLLPEVYERLKTAATDEARERLTALRYRLAESDRLALNWPGGIERLASPEPETRYRAADELAGRATLSDEALLLELFSDQAALVREISLRALMQVGGTNVNSALVRLLEDPEPNVRAAVLKQLAETPSAALIERIATYVAAEPDPDLVVHAVRVLSGVPGNASNGPLTSLLTHESWRVRAEAAEALGKKVTGHQNPQQPQSAKADIFTAMIELLKDTDGFVISRAVEALAHADLLAAVEPLARAAEAHPELAVDIAKALSYGQNQRKRAVVHLRRFAGHANPKMRAAAIAGLSVQPSAELADDLRRALHDEESDVRIAGANAFFGVLENRRRADDANVILGTYRDAAAAVPETDEEEPTLEADNEAEPQQRAADHRDAEAPPPAADAPRVVVPDEAPVAAGEVPPDVAAPAPTKGAKPAPKPRPATAPAGNFLKTFIGGIKAAITGVATDDADINEAERMAPDAADAADGPDESSFADRDRAEEWLRVIRSQRFLPKWQRDVRGDLEPLLAAADARERVATVLPLAALGADDVALPEMLNLIEADPKFIARLSEALPWLLAADREKVVEGMLARPAGADDLTTIAANLAEIRSPQAESALWKLIAQPRADWATAETVKSSLVQFYFPKHYYQLPQAPIRDQKRAIAAATSHARTGAHRQRLVGLALLLSLEGATAAEIARPLVDDEAAAIAERSDFLQVVLVALSEAEAVPLAVKQLVSQHAAFRERALARLTGNAHELQSLRDGAFHLSANSWYGGFSLSGGGQVIVPEAPLGLTVEPLLPLLASNDPKVAAQAGYLAALLGRGDGLPMLISYWRTKAAGDVDWMRLVYRAIATLDEGSQVPVLREIYSRLNNDNSRHYLQEFYWTIRSMTAPEVLPLRKTIRDEVGMDQLR